MANLHKITEHLDSYLGIREITDFSGAFNGLQVENSGTVAKVAAAVDACEFTINAAAECGADLLLVHHGLFWSDPRPFTGVTYRKCKAVIANDLAVYSSHLPLDAHPRLGNNALLCRALGWRKSEPFFFEKGQHIGRRVETRIERGDLQERLADVVGGAVHLLPGGPDTCRKVGVVSGGAGAELRVAAAEGVDTFITGEGPHWSYTLAEELGVNVFYAGHYATETFGVKALAEYVSSKFEIPWAFIDHPSGL